MNAIELHTALKRLDAWPHAVKRPWASRITADFYLRKGYVSPHIAALLNEILSGLPIFKYNHNHDPENGQFTSGSSEDANPSYPNEQWPKQGNSNLKINNAIHALDENAQENSTGRCAHYVAQAISAGGVSITAPADGYAKNYGPSREDAGFVKL